MSTKFTYVWFDLGYTLLYMQRERTYQEALKQNGINIGLKALEKGFHIMDKHFMKNYPGVFNGDRETYMPWYLGALNFLLGVKLDACKIDRDWKNIQDKTPNYWMPFDNVHEVLSELKDLGICLGVISNWDDSIREILSDHELVEYFDNIIISNEVGYEKPNTEIFKIALKEANVRPENCLYVGDNYYDDSVSEKVGINYLLINRFGRLGVEELKNQTIIKDISEVKKYILHKVAI